MTMSALIECNAPNMQSPVSVNWIDVCTTSDLINNSGICALINTSDLQTRQASNDEPNEEQIAIFYIPSSEKVYALSNWDPIGKANVMYRGIVGSIAEEPCIASPLYKQHYSLISGQCFEQADTCLKVFEARIHQGKVQVSQTRTLQED